MDIQFAELNIEKVGTFLSNPYVRIAHYSYKNRHNPSLSIRPERATLYKNDSVEILQDITVDDILFHLTLKVKPIDITPDYVLLSITKNYEGAMIKKFYEGESIPIGYDLSFTLLK